MLCRGIAPHLSTLMKECHIKYISGDAPAPHGVIDFVLGPMKQCSEFASIVCMTGTVSTELEDISVVETKNEGNLEQRGNFCCYKV